jgi:hypothetical protein
MTMWVEVTLQSSRSDDGSICALAETLQRIAAFAGATPLSTRFATREIPLQAPGWRLSVETLEGARTLCAVETEGAPMPGFMRYRTFARPAGEDLSASLIEFAQADEALRGPLAKAYRQAEAETVVTPDAIAPELEVERIEWRIDANGADILATLETSAQTLPTLRLAAAPVNGALDAVFSVAGEVIDAAPFYIAPDDEHASEAEPVYAATLDLPRTATRRAAPRSSRLRRRWRGSGSATRRPRARVSAMSTCINCASRSGGSRHC